MVNLVTSVFITINFINKSIRIIFNNFLRLFVTPVIIVYFWCTIYLLFYHCYHYIHIIISLSKLFTHCLWCNAKSFQIVFVVVFLFLFLVSIIRRTYKTFLGIFQILFPKKHVANTGLFKNVDLKISS